jgi:Ala-tRNA(Pro) deacylase
MLYDVVTYVDESLTEEDYIVFEAGTHKDAVKMQYQDYRQIARPRVEDISFKVVSTKPVAS